MCSPCPSSSEATSRVLAVVSLSGPVAVPFDRGHRGLRVHMTVPPPTSLQRRVAFSAHRRIASCFDAVGGAFPVHLPSNPSPVTRTLGFGLVVLWEEVSKSILRSAKRTGVRVLPGSPP